MYHFSRAIYRELAPRVVEDARDPTGCRNKQLVLDACEYTIRRLIDDGRYCRRPARFLFSEIRPYFSLSDQAYAWRVIEINVGLAREFLARLPAGVSPDGQPLRCHAQTRRGAVCQRVPRPGREYCPSHKHLEEFYEDAELPAAAAGLPAAA